MRPNEDQKALLENLRKASDEAAVKFRDSCPETVPMTPPGRLQAIMLRLKATDEAIKIVKPALTAFYGSLSDEQKARFNEIGVQLGQPQQQGASQMQPAIELQRREDRPVGPRHEPHRRGRAALRTQGTALDRSTKQCRRR